MTEWTGSREAMDAMAASMLTHGSAHLDVVTS